MTETKTPKKRGRPVIPPDRLAAARILYESTPGLTIAQTAVQVGCGTSSLKLASSSQGWTKKYQTGEMTPEAHALADKFNKGMESIPEITIEPTPSPPPAAALVEKLTDEMAIDVRAKLLERHRDEWKAPRGMSSEAVLLRNSDPLKAFDRARLAKITAETLKLVQEGERKAYGLDVVTPPLNHVVVIERD